MIPIGQWLAEHADDPVAFAVHSGIETSIDDVAQTSVERLIEEAFARGKSEVEMEYREKLEIASFEARERCEKLLEEVRRHWLEEQVSPLTEKFRVAHEEMEARLMDIVASVLKPFLSDKVNQRALDEFKAIVTSHLANAESCPLRLKAPRDLLEILGQYLRQNGLAVTLEEGAGCDLMLEAGKTTFESQAARWLAAIESAGDG